MAAGSSSSFNSSDSGMSVRYDVFLSFSGRDNKFTSHLAEALRQNGFLTFHDIHKQEEKDPTKEVERISSVQVEAIKGSRVSIIVLSSNSADSECFLDEVAQIMDCHGTRSTKKITVLPVFYNVEPSDVRRQGGPYAISFDRHRTKFRRGQVKQWKAALNAAGNLSGSHLLNDANRNEAEFIKQIVREVAKCLNTARLYVARYPVGIEYRVQQVIERLRLGEDGVHIVAIWGVGGIGKTTIAKAIYNQIADDFERTSFLANVRETSWQSNELLSLQNQLFSDLLKNGKQKIYNCDQGTELIKRRLESQRVLIVVDDVGIAKQLDWLAINRECLCPGSRIIVTTKDITSISSLGNVAVYKPNELDKSDSLKLFTHYAFGEEHTKQVFKELSEEVVECSEGLPLLLSIWGAYMRSFKTEEQWRKVLEKLRIIPLEGVQKKLEISFDPLPEEEKELFKDIVCFFVGMEKEFVVKILEDGGSRWTPEDGIELLVSRCLLTVDFGKKLSMHDMVRDMGREIVYKESKDPGERSRLWDRKEVIDVLTDCSVTEAVEGISLDLPESNEVKVNVEAFAKMNRLRLLRSNYLDLDCADVMNSSEKLKWLQWHGFPLEYIPGNLYMGNLVAIDLQNSRLKQLWEGTQSLNRLRFLNFSHSRFLTRTPDLSGLKNLEKLLLCDCKSLVEIHGSVGCLDKVESLDLSNCVSLTKIPSSIHRMKSLRDLMLSGCFKIESGLTAFLLQASVLGSENSGITSLSLEDCNLSHIPGEIKNLHSLHHLNLGGNKFRSLPKSLQELHNLVSLHLNNCARLESIDYAPKKLEHLDTADCPSLETIPLPGKWHENRVINCPGCPKMMESNFAKDFRSKVLRSSQDWRGRFGSRMVEFILGLLGPIPLPEPQRWRPNYRGSLPRFSRDAAERWRQRDPLLPGAHYPDINVALSGSVVPDWIKFRSTGSSIHFAVPPYNKRQIRGWITCVVSDGKRRSLGRCRVTNVSKDMKFSFFLNPLEGQMWLSYVTLENHKFPVERGDKIVIEFSRGWNEQIVECGLSLVYEGDEMYPERIHAAAPEGFLRGAWNRYPHKFFWSGFFLFRVCKYLFWVSPQEEIEAALRKMEERGEKVSTFWSIVQVLFGLIIVQTIFSCYRIYIDRLVRNATVREDNINQLRRALTERYDLTTDLPEYIDELTRRLSSTETI